MDRCRLWAVVLALLSSGGTGCELRFAAEAQCATDLDCGPGLTCGQGRCQLCPTCGEGERCSLGACVPVGCPDLPCASGLVCRQDSCAWLACDAVSCPPTMECSAGQCVPIQCADRLCPPGTGCVGGVCRDLTCNAVVCESGFSCSEGICRPCERSELRCDDGSDEDCDGTLDCADPDCFDQRCGPGSSCGEEVCNLSGICVHLPLSAGLECRRADGACDEAESCDGASLSCPPDRVRPASVECRGSAGDCDPAESCDGLAPACPADQLRPVGFECRGVAGPCDLAEACDGLSASCPTDLFFDAGVVCRPRAGACDAEERCSGTAADCPPDGSSICNPAVLTFDSPTYDFGQVVVGLSASQTVTVTNVGAWTASLGSVTAAGLGLVAPFDLLPGGSCATGASLAPGLSCTLIVQFVPTAAVVSDDSIDLGYDDGASTQTASLAVTGTGAGRALVTISAGPILDLGTRAIGSIYADGVDLTNSGGVAATLGTISTPGLSLAAPFVMSSAGTCATGASLAPGASCHMSIAFLPSVEGSFTDTIELVYTDDLGAQTALRPVAGTGAAAGTIAISDGPTYDYGSHAVGSTTPKTFTATNTGHMNVTLGTVTAADLGLAPPYTLAGGTCATNAVVAPAAACTLTVGFAPTAAVASPDSIDLGYQGGLGPRTASRPITGTGVSPAVLTLSDGPTFDYGTQVTGAWTSKTFTAANSGGSSATLGTISTVALGLAAPYSLTGGSCASGGAVAPNGSCTLTVAFAPTAYGAAGDTISLAYDDGAAAQVVTRPVTGSGVLANGQPCSLNPQCLNVCIGGTCGAQSGAGGSCDELADCTTGLTCNGTTCESQVSCDDGNPCTDDSWNGSSCVYVNNTASCDDGYACTTPDVCHQGSCTGGAVSNAGACGTDPKIIDRSVGVSSGAAMASNNGTLKIQGTTAIFQNALPDKVGVGDVIQYSTDGGPTPNALAFVRSRVSSKVYSVRDRAGGTPAATATTTSNWAVFRAFLSLAYAIDTPLAGQENTNINAAMRDFDQFLGLTDLTAAGLNQIRNVACYDEGVVDSTAVRLCDREYPSTTGDCVGTADWQTDGAHYIRLFTPKLPSEVGVSQRHTGVPGTGYRRTAPITVFGGYARIEGISSTVGANRNFFVMTDGTGGEVRISHCFGRNTDLTAQYIVYDVWQDAPVGSTPMVIKMWNNIAINETSYSRAGFYINSPNALAYLYNNTAVVQAGGAFVVGGQTPTPIVHLKNGLAYDRVYADAQRAIVGTFASLSNTVTNDDSFDLISGETACSGRVTYSFAGGGDYHLASTPASNPLVAGAGANLSADAQLAFDDDLDGDARPASPTAWDIGADQINRGAPCDVPADCLSGYACNGSYCVACAVYCDDGNPCTDDACDAGGACVHSNNTASCFEGDICTTPDVCYQGVCTGGAVSATGACGTDPKQIYRSAGVSAGAAQASNNGSLTIRGTTAIFANDLPASVGVGDVIQYSTDGAATPNALAFVSGRVSAKVYSVRNSSGGTPTATASTSSYWSVFRAYLSLAKAVDNTVGGTENTNLAASLRDFDAFVGGKNLVTANQVWNVACYDDGVEDGEIVHLGDKSFATRWQTDPTHYIKIFTPTSATQAGANQRHNGTWGTGYRRTHAIHTYDRSVWFDGLSLYQNAPLTSPDFLNRAYIFYTHDWGSLIRVSNCFGWGTQGSNRVFDLCSSCGTGMTSNGAATTTVKIWNSIGIQGNPTAGNGGAAFLNNSSNAVVHFYNNTGIVAGGMAFFNEAAGANTTSINNLGYTTGGGVAFSVQTGSNRFQNSYCASSDNSSDSNTVTSTRGTNKTNVTITFANAGAGNYHLNPSAGLNVEIRGTGTNLSTNPNIPFADDIDGQSRPAPTAGWDIGADQAQ